MKKKILISKKEIFFIFSLAIIFSLISFIYYSFKQKNYQTSITIYTEPFISYQVIDPTLLVNFYETDLLKPDLKIKYYDNFKYKIDSSEHKEKFFSKKNLKLKDVKFAIPEFKKNKKNFELSMIYNSEKVTEYKSILIDFVNFTSEAVVYDYKKQLSNIIDREIQIYKNNSDIAKKIGYQLPVTVLDFNLVKKGSITDKTTLNDFSNLFFLGYQVLDSKIKFLEKNLQELGNIQDIKFVSSSPKDSIELLGKNLFIGLGFFSGLVLAIFLVFINFFFLQKKNKLNLRNIIYYNK